MCKDPTSRATRESCQIHLPGFRSSQQIRYVQRCEASFTLRKYVNYQTGRGNAKDGKASNSHTPQGTFPTTIIQQPTATYHRYPHHDNRPRTSPHQQASQWPKRWGQAKDSRPTRQARRKESSSHRNSTRPTQYQIYLPRRRPIQQANNGKSISLDLGYCGEREVNHGMSECIATCRVVMPHVVPGRVGLCVTNAGRGSGYL